MDPATNPSTANPGGNTPPSSPPAMPMPGAVAPTPGGAAPVANVLTGADASWLPPTVPVSPSAGGQPAGQGQAVVPAPAVADDGDVIEKEWVVKAKRIIEQTRQDPYKQTRELHKFRAEYLKKRYNKIIEPVDE